MTTARTLLVLALVVLTGAVTALPAASAAPSSAACAPLAGPDQIPDAALITFDDLPDGANISNHYQAGFGVTFEDSRTARVNATTLRDGTHSPPNVARSEALGDPATTALNVYFDSAQSHVGLFVGNGGNEAVAMLAGYDADGNQICAAQVNGVPDAHTAFIGVADPDRRIVSIALSYAVAGSRAESIDDLAFASVAPAPTPAIFLFPAALAPGGEPAVSGYGFPALADLRLFLTCPDSAELDLGGTRTDAAGRLRAAVIAPAFPPNPCLLAARQGRTNLAEAALTLLPALQLTFSPQTGPPGTTVNFTARNLSAGELRLDYASRAAFGPAAVTAGSFSGAFTVPGDRPDPLGEMAELQATNLVLGRKAATASGDFASQTGPTPPDYRVADLQLPVANLPPGSDFTITGRISPAPQGPLSQFQVVPVWRKADGRSLPIGRGATQIGADGKFSALARVPSLLTGDPTWPEAGDLSGVMLVTPGDQPQPFLQAVAGLPIFPTFNVKVVDAATKQLIPAAAVSFEAWQSYAVSAGSLGGLAGQAATGISNQIGQVMGTTELTDDELAQMALMKLLCMPQPIPVNANKWDLINPTLDQTLSQPAVQGLVQGNSVIIESVGVATAGLSPAAGQVIPYLLTVDALDAGYGLKDAEGAVKNLSLRVNFHLADFTYRDLGGNVLPNPFSVALTKLSSGDQSALGPINTLLAGIGAPEQSSPTSLPRFVRYHSVANAPAGVQVTKIAEGRVLVSLSVAQFHKLGAGGMKLYLDGVWIANIPLQFNPGLSCNKLSGAIKQTSDPFYQGKAVIPNAHLLAVGARALQVRAQLQGGQWVNYDYILQVDALPASWFSVKAAGTRTLTWQPGEVYLHTAWLSAAASTQLLHSDPAKTDETGQLDNRSVPASNISQRADANGHKGPQISGQLAGQALNRDGQGCNLSNCPANSAAAAAAAADPLASHTYGPRTESVVPDVTFDLPEVKYGIPFVAEVAAGGSISYGATVTYQGSATVLSDGGVQSLLTIHPEAHTSGTVYVEGRLLAGLIGKAGASLTANFDVHMPVTYDTAKSDPLVAGTYFEYGADFKAWHKWGCVPYAGCAYSKTYPQHLFDGCEELAGSGGCAAVTAAQAEVVAADPPQFDLQVAASGQGALMAIWPQSRSSLATSLFNGVAWSAAGSIATGLGNSQPQIVFLTPNRALAVWTETNLSEAQLPGLTGEDLLRAQRIAYAVWDGVSWSASQPLTSPSLGEGGPALAACPAGQPGCPAGGVAVAVWERNLSANLEARDIRLYYARYQNGVWSAVQPVDAAGAFTDILPQAVFVNGAPLVAWVRDSDANLSDGASRRIALRFLDGGAAFTPATLPAAIAEVALGVDGTSKPVLAFTQLEDATQLLTNRRPLWAAAGNCTGPTTCTWQPVKLTDAAGRALYAEQPLLTTDAAGQVLVTFRGMGFGGAGNVQPGDPPGMTSGQGELAQATLNFATGQVAPKYLTQDGAVNWLPAAAYDPLLGVSLATAVKGSLPTGLASGTQAARPADSPAPDLPIAAALVPNLPDFLLLGGAVTGGPATGEPLRAVVRIANSGAAWPGSAEQPLEIVAAWDGPPGIGVPAGQIGLTSLAMAPFVTVTLDLTPPSAGLDAAHALHLAVNPGLPIPEADAGNNSLTLTAGGILPPLGLWAQTREESALVFLGWEAAADRRVAGYRVYRAGGDGVWQPLGSSFAPGYVDVTAAVGAGYRYAVAVYTADGGESPLGPLVAVAAQLRSLFLPLVTRGVR